MGLEHRLRAWTYSRQRLGPSRATTATEALRAVIGVYSAHPTAPLALAARTRGLAADGFRALEQHRQALRIPAMRQSIFLVPREEAGRIFAPFAATSAITRRRLDRVQLSDEDYAAVTERVLAEAVEPRRARDLEQAVGLRGSELLTVLRALRHEGLILPVGGGSLRIEQFRYVSTSVWVGSELSGFDAGESLRWLAERYVHAFGPARSLDFAWWAGVSRGAAAAALGSLDTVDLGDGLLLPRADEAEFDRPPRRLDSVDLLPKWDSYTMGLAPDGRSRLVHPDVAARVYSSGVRGTLPGDGLPVVLVDGCVAGTWRMTVKDGASAELFDTVGPRVQRRIDAAFGNVTALLAG